MKEWFIILEFCGHNKSRIPKLSQLFDFGQSSL